MSDPKRIEHNIIRMIWDNSNRTFHFSYFVDDFAYKAYSCSYKLFIDAVEDPEPGRAPVEMYVSTNDEGVNVPGVINISDYRGRLTFPDYEFDEMYDLKCARIKEASLKPWTIDKILWIGKVYDTHTIRKKLMTMKSERCEFLSSADTFISHEDHCKYRYLLDVEGGPSANASTGYSLRVKFLMYTGRLLFIVDRPLWSWAEMLLEPWVHYVPVKRDLSDLEEKIQWADTHPEEVSKMIENTTRIAPSRKDAVNQVKRLIKANT